MSKEDFDLSPECSEKPSIHCLNDDVLRHVFGYLNLIEKLRIETVCRRWQDLVYTMVGRKRAVDLTAFECPWQDALSISSLFRTSPEIGHVKSMRQKYRSGMCKMLILNEAYLTTLHLDEHWCFIDANIVSAIGRFATNLEVLSLRFSKNRSHSTSLQKIFSNCSKLKTVCFYNLHSTSLLFTELQCCKSLEVLRLRAVVKLSTKGKLTLPLKELSLSDILAFKLDLQDILQPNLRTFRLFTTHDLDNFPFDAEKFTKLLRTCPDLEELQVTYCNFTLPFNLFKNLKILQVQSETLKFMRRQLQMDLPAIEELRIQFTLKSVNEEFLRGRKRSFDFSRHVPSSVKSLTLPSLALDDASYESLLALPNLERIYFKSINFPAALLEKFVSRTHIVEIGAGMLEMTHHAVKALASVRRKALAKATKNAATHDSAQPLVLHILRLTDGDGKFQDPLLKINELRGDGYLYDHVGWTRFDNEWVDFGFNFGQDDFDRSFDDDYFSDHSDGDSSDDLSYDPDHSSYLAQRFWAGEGFFGNEFDDGDDDDPNIRKFYD